MDSDIFGIIIAVYFLVTCNNKVYQFMWTQQKAPDGSRVLRLVQNCGPSVWRVLHVTLLASRGGAPLCVPEILILQLCGDHVQIV